MSDTPDQMLLQQLHARPVSGEHLEVLGKTAAVRWDNGEYRTLTEAVVDTVKHASLSPEQVKRVVEFANTDAYLREFKKEGSEHKIVSFPGGPADPAEVLRDLNDGGGGSVFDKGANDYSNPPEEMKTASLSAERAFEEAFLTDLQSDAPAYPMANPYGEAIELRDKLAAAYDQLQSELGELEYVHAEASRDLYENVKQAAMGGTNLGEIVRAWQSISPTTEHVKCAFQYLSPRLVEGAVFQSLDALGESLEKTGSFKRVNEQHPIVQSFAGYCESLSKLAQARAAQEEIQQGHEQLTYFLQKAAADKSLLAKGVEHILSAAAKGGELAGTHLPGVVGPEAAGLLGKAIRYSPHALATLAAVEVGRHALNDPLIRKAQGYVNPLSDEWKYRTYQMQGGQ